MIETQIHDALVKLQRSIEKAEAEGIRASLEELEQLAREHRKEIDPQLRHYLKNRSYVKALAFVRGESDIPKGICGGRKDFS